MIPSVLEKSELTQDRTAGDGDEDSELLETWGNQLSCRLWTLEKPYA